MASRSLLGALALSLSASACVATQGVSTACDINYVGPPPQHYVEAGWALDRVLVVDLPSETVLEQCGGDTPVGCAISRPDLGWYFAIVTTEPERWGLTRDYIVEHEVAHLGGWDRCHNN